MRTKYPFKMGETVIFDPDMRSFGYNQYSFDNENIYPGKIVIVTKIDNKGFLHVDAKTGYPSDQFILFTDDKCPFDEGDVVKFTPSDRTNKRFTFLNDPKPGREYVVKKIINRCWVFVDKDVKGYYWTDYTFVRKGESVIRSDKSLNEFIQNILDLLENSETRTSDKWINHWIKFLKENSKKLEMNLSMKERWKTLINLEAAAMGGVNRLIELHLHHMTDSKLNEAQLNKEYFNLVYDFYWRIRLEKEKLAPSVLNDKT